MPYLTEEAAPGKPWGRQATTRFWCEDPWRTRPGAFRGGPGAHWGRPEASRGAIWCPQERDAGGVTIIPSWQLHGTHLRKRRQPKNITDGRWRVWARAEAAEECLSETVRGRGGRQCCGSGIFISGPHFCVHPRYRIPDPGSRVLDPKTATKEKHSMLKPVFSNLKHESIPLSVKKKYRRLSPSFLAGQ
jgi:hypothetical protein